MKEPAEVEEWQLLIDNVYYSSHMIYKWISTLNQQESNQWFEQEFLNKLSKK